MLIERSPHKARRPRDMLHPTPRRHDDAVRHPQEAQEPAQPRRRPLGDRAAHQAADYDQLAEHILANAKGEAVIVAGHTNLYLDGTVAASSEGQDGRIWKAFLDQTGLSAMKSGEKESLEDHAAGRPHEGRPREPGPPLTPNTRLGCHAKVLGSGARIQVPALFTMEDIKGAEGAG